MSNSGFSLAKEKSEKIASALRDVSVLIGQRNDESVTLETGESIIPGLGFNNDASILAKQAHEIEQGIFNVIVLGEFKNGKSTLLNAMLGEKTLPSKNLPCTAIITKIVYGDSDKVALYESGKDSPRILSWEDFNRDFKLTYEDQDTLEQKGYIDRFSQIEYAQIERHNRFCNNGVRLIDSPGLKENVARTKVAINFLKQSQAIIFLLKADKMLSQDERKFIEDYFEPGQINNVFFVINFINRVEQQEVDEVKEYTKKFLSPYYLNKKGEFDEIVYNRRVFFINALGALNARIGDADKAVLESSGVPELEKELERFLASPEKTTAAFDSTVQLLSFIVSQSREKINQEKSALDQPLNELEERRKRTQEKLQPLKEKKKDIETTILLYGEMIAGKIYSDLMDYVDEIHKTWSVDCERFIELNDIGVFKLLKAGTFSKKAQEEISQQIGEEAKRYLEIKIKQWAKRIPTVIGEDMENFKKQVEEQVEEFQIELDKIRNMFSGIETKDAIDLNQRKGQKVVQFILGLGDLSQMTGSFLGEGDWLSFLGRIIQQIVLVTIIESLAFALNPAFWVLFFVAEGVLIKSQGDNARKNIREKLGQKINETLLTELPKKKNEICKNIKKQFEEQSQEITSNLQGQINDICEEQDTIIKLKQNTSFNVKKEKCRLDAVEKQLFELFNRVSMVIYGKHVTPEEIDQMTAKRKEILMTN